MELKNVTIETKIEECDFFTRRTIQECHWHEISTIGQLLNVPMSEIEKWHGWKAPFEIRLFFAEYKKDSNPYQIETRVIAGKTCIKLNDVIVKGSFNKDFVKQDNIWINSDCIIGFFESYYMGITCLMCKYGNGMTFDIGLVKFLEEKNNDNG